MGYEIDSLDINLKTHSQTAITSIDSFIKRLDRLNASLTSVNSRGLSTMASGINKLSNATNNFSRNTKNSDFSRLSRSIKTLNSIDASNISRLSGSLKSLSSGLSSISSVSFNASSLDGIVNSLRKLGSIKGTSGTENLTRISNNLGQFVRQMNSIGSLTFDVNNLYTLINGISKLGFKSSNNATKNLPIISANLQNFVRQMNKIGSLDFKNENLSNLISSISKLGYKSSTKAIDNIPKLATAMRDLMNTLSKAPRVSQNLIDMTNALAKLARTGASSGRAATSLSKSFDLYTNSSNRASKSSWSLAATIGKVYATYWILFRAFGKIRDSINIASDLVEVQNVVDTVFGDMTSKVEAYADKSIEQFGMSELAFKQYASRFQAMGAAMGIDSGLIGDANSFLSKSTNGYVELSNSMADVSLNLTKLAADMASFYNVEQSAVAEDLAAIFTGETRPLRTYGLDLTQATLSEWAMKQGLDANIQSMSQAEKTMLRYQYVLANTTAAQGDFIRTQDTWANQIRILQEQLKKWASVIGTGFIAAFKPFLQNLNVVMGKVIDFSENVLNALGKIFGWQFEISGAGITNDLADSMEDTDLATGDASGSAGDLSDNLGDAAKNAKKLYSTVLGIDELNINNPDTGSSSGSAGTGSGSGGSGSIGSGSGSSGSGLTTIMTRNDAIIKAYESSIDSLYELGEYIGDTLTNVMKNIDWNKAYEKAIGFGTGLADFLNGLISPELFGTLGSTIAKSINTALTSINIFAKVFDWDNLGESLATSIDSFFRDWDAELTGETFSNLVSGILEALTSYIETIGEDDTFEEIGQKLVDFICGIEWGELTWDLGKFFLALSQAMLDFPNDFARGVAQGIIDKIFGEDSGIEAPEISLPPTSLLFILNQFDSIKKKAINTGADISKAFYDASESLKIAWENKDKIFKDFSDKIKQNFSDIPDWFKEKFESAYQNTKNAFSNIGTWFHERYDSVKGVFKDTESFFKNAFKKAYDAVVGIWSGLGTFFRTVANSAFSPIKSLVNGVIKGVNWVLDLLGSDTQFEIWQGVKFAKGSDGLKQNTLGVVNDQPGSTYKELIVPPKGQPFIPKGRNVMLPLEKGTKIMPAGQTKSLMNDTPHFAKGIGSFFGNAWESISKFTGNVMDYFENPGKLVQIAFDKFIDTSRWGGAIGNIGTGIINTIFDSAVEFIKNVFGSNKIEQAVRWAIGIANDNSHGYDQTHRTGPDYDCSSLVTIALEKAGLGVSLGTTKTMLNQLLSAGFKNVTDSVNRGSGSGMKRGDVLLKPGSHTAMYIGDDKIVHARINEFGGVNGGKTGDQTGNEIAVTPYHNHPWTYVLRYAKRFRNGVGSFSLSDFIPAYSVGGFPEDGLFMANHNELVGRFDNGRTAVANNDNIQSGIKEGVREAVSEILAPYLQQIAQNTRETADKDLIVNIGDREIAQANKRGQSRMGYSFT